MKPIRLKITPASGAASFLPCRKAEGFLERGLGWLGKRHLDQDDALWLAPCQSVHSFFMRVRFDAVFVGREGRILKIRPDMGPWSAAWGGAGCGAVLELAPGAAARLGLAVGDLLEVSDEN